MNKLKKLPVGREDFGEIRTKNFYYVDKTKLIEQILEEENKVTLFTLFLFNELILSNLLEKIQY